MLPFQVQSCAISVGRDVFGVSRIIGRELFWDYTYVELAKQPNIKSQSPKTSASDQKNRLICGHRADKRTRGGNKLPPIILKSVRATTGLP